MIIYWSNFSLPVHQLAIILIPDSPVAISCIIYYLHAINICIHVAMVTHMYLLTIALHDRLLHMQLLRDFYFQIF